MGAGQGTQAGRKSEGGQEVRGGQQPAALPFEPAGRLWVLAFGTVAVFAGMVLILTLLTGRAKIDVSPERGRTASPDIGETRRWEGSIRS
jgi:hypothetical protein